MFTTYTQKSRSDPDDVSRSRPDDESQKNLRHKIGSTRVGAEVGADAMHIYVTGRLKSLFKHSRNMRFSGHETAKAS